MARVEVNIRFIYEDTLYVDTLAYIPRHEAIKIPELKVEENQAKVSSQRMQVPPKQTSTKNNKNKKESDVEEEIADENQDFDPENDELQNLENDIQNEIEPDQMDEEEPDQDLEQIENEDIPQNQYDQDDDEEQDEIQNDDLSDISRSGSGIGNYGKFKTKRQKGQLDNFLELPLKKPRKDAKKFDEATELIKKQQKERKRRQYIKKLMQAQQKATFDKILNETGRKFRQRQEKEQNQQNKKQKREYKTLGDVPKLIIRSTKNKEFQLLVRKMQLFPASLNYEPNVKMSQNCLICKSQIGKYKTRQGVHFCSVPCFNKIKAQSAIAA